MPWSVGDVDKHKKGLTPAQKKKWVSVANGVLKDCQAKGGDDCEGKAIRIANSKFSEEVTMKREPMKVPDLALHLVDHDCFASTIGAEGEKKKLDMVIYSGGIIRNHWWWGNLAIDLNGMQFPKKRYPILEQHDIGKKIGFSDKPVIEGNKLKLNPDKVEFVDTPYATEFIKLSKAGFPFESSMYAVPIAVERLEEGASAQVNGFTMTGPGTIWKQSIFKEASVCVFGYDSNTRSEAMSKEIELSVDIQSTNFKEKEVKSDMITLEQFKQENPDEYNSFVLKIKEDVTKELQTKFDKEKTDLTNKFATEKQDLENKMSDRDKRILELEKKDAIRAEKELKARSEKIWSDRLSESNIPSHLYDKVMKHVSYSQFVKDGILDEVKFMETIDAEVKDWETKGVNSSVMGVGFSSKKPDGQNVDQAADAKLVEDTTNNLLKLANQKVDKR